MRKLLLALLLINGALLVAQGTTSTTWTLQPLSSVPAGNVQLQGNGGPATYYFWVVANYLIGNASPAGPYILQNGPNAFSGSNYATVNWQAANGALSYDVLMTSTAVPPTGACACAVATGVSALTQNAISNTLSAYTVTTFDPTQFAIVTTNQQKAAGVSAWTMSLANGNVLGTVDSNGVGTGAFAGGSGHPANPNSAVQFNNGGAFGGSANLTWNNGTQTFFASKIFSLAAQGIQHVCQQAGADIGAQVLAAYNNLPTDLYGVPSGTVSFDGCSGYYSWTTQVVMTGAHVKIVGDNNTSGKVGIQCNATNCLTLQQAPAAVSSDGNNGSILQGFEMDGNATLPNQCGILVSDLYNVKFSDMYFYGFLDAGSSAVCIQSKIANTTGTEGTVFDHVMFSTNLHAVSFSNVSGTQNGGSFGYQAWLAVRCFSNVAGSDCLNLNGGLIYGSNIQLDANISANNVAAVRVAGLEYTGGPGSQLWYVNLDLDAENACIGCTNVALFDLASGTVATGFFRIHVNTLGQAMATLSTGTAGTFSPFIDTLGSYKVAGTTVIDSSRNATVNNLTVQGTCTGCGSGGSPAGVLGDFQGNNGSGGFSALHVNDNGTSVTTTEPFAGKTVGYTTVSTPVLVGTTLTVNLATSNAASYQLPAGNTTIAFTLPPYPSQGFFRLISPASGTATLTAGANVTGSLPFPAVAASQPTIVHWDSDSSTVYVWGGVAPTQNYGQCGIQSAPGVTPAAGSLYGWCSPTGHQSVLPSTGTAVGEWNDPGAGIPTRTAAFTHSVADAAAMAKPIVASAVGGTADAITITLTPALAAQTQVGTVVRFTPGANNATTTPTAAVSGLAALTIKKKSGSGLAAVAAGDIVSGESATLELDPTVTYWVLTNPQTGSVSAGVSSIQPKNAGVSYGSAATGDILFNVAGCTWSGTVPNLTLTCSTGTNNPGGAQHSQQFQDAGSTFGGVPVPASTNPQVTAQVNGSDPFTMMPLTNSGLPLLMNPKVVTLTLSAIGNSAGQQMKDDSTGSVYVVPGNRTAVVQSVSAYNSGSTISTWYDDDNATHLTILYYFASAAVNTAGLSYALPAGHVLSLTPSAAAGTNASAVILEADATSGYHSSIVGGNSSTAAQILYTVPLSSHSYSLTRAGANAGNLICANSSGSTSVVTLNAIPAGGSIGAGNVVASYTQAVTSASSTAVTGGLYSSGSNQAIYKVTFGTGLTNLQIACWMNFVDDTGTH